MRVMGKVIDAFKSSESRFKVIDLNLESIKLNQLMIGCTNIFKLIINMKVCREKVGIIFV